MLATIQQTYQEKMDAVMTMLEEGIKDVFTSGRFQDYLSMMAKFHSYSFRNTMLILMQRPDATKVAGFHTWMTGFERRVSKGEVGIRILAPYTFKKDMLTNKTDSYGQVIYDKNTGQPIKELKKVDVQSFKIVYVFDVSQTEGKPLPELMEELKATVDNADEIEKAIRKITDCKIEYAEITNGSKGYYDTSEHKIVIKEGMSSLHSIKTMIHELAHSRLHGKDCSDKKDRSTMEVEAESIAFTVLQFLGINTSDYSFAYLASWSSNQELKELSASLSTIQKETNEIIQLLTKEMSNNQ
jgi:hypothetical protein